MRQCKIFAAKPSCDRPSAYRSSRSLHPFLLRLSAPVGPGLDVAQPFNDENQCPQQSWRHTITPGIAVGLCVVSLKRKLMQSSVEPLAPACLELMLTHSCVSPAFLAAQLGGGAAPTRCSSFHPQQAKSNSSTLCAFQGKPAAHECYYLIFHSSLFLWACTFPDVPMLSICFR